MTVQGICWFNNEEMIQSYYIATFFASFSFEPVFMGLKNDKKTICLFLFNVQMYAYFMQTLLRIACFTTKTI